MTFRGHSSSQSDATSGPPSLLSEAETSSSQYVKTKEKKSESYIDMGTF